MKTCFYSKGWKYVFVAKYVFSCFESGIKDPNAEKQAVSASLYKDAVEKWAILKHSLDALKKSQIVRYSIGGLRWCSVVVKFEIYNDGEYRCARGIGVDIFTQGKTLDELMGNVKEAFELHFDEVLSAGEDIDIVDIRVWSAIACQSYQ